MNTATISKITSRGQITLPNRVRNAGAFKHAGAVEFVQQNDTLIVRPIAQKNTAQSEHVRLLDSSMQDWFDSENDDIFTL